MKELNVFFFTSPKEKQLIGQLAQVEDRIFFEYAPEFIEKSLFLSPYKLPLESGVHEHKDKNFGPIFGLFDDSLPDGWGLLLMDRFLRQQGVNFDRVSVLDRLAFLGRAAMGALTYEPAVKHNKFDKHVKLQALADQSRQIMEGKTTDILPELMRTGGSPGGARPKVLIGINKKTDQIIAGEEDLPELFEHWIVKFNSKKDLPDSGAVEYAYSLMAGKSGILMPETRLFKLNSGDRFFGIKRFDRKKNQRFHIHTFGNLIHSNFRIPECDYETFLKVTMDLTKNYQDLEQGFHQMIFNILANNRDDHVKNFAFMITEKGEWAMTPAYDITFSRGPGGEHSMSVAGEGRSPGKQAISRLGQLTGFPQKNINNIIDQTIASLEQWSEFAGQAGINEQTKEYIQKKIERNIAVVKD